MNTSYSGYSGSNVCLYTLGTIGIISTLFYTTRQFNILKKKLKEERNRNKESKEFKESNIQTDDKIMKTTSIQCDLHLSTMENEIEIVPASLFGNRWFFLKEIIG